MMTKGRQLQPTGKTLRFMAVPPGEGNRVSEKLLSSREMGKEATGSIR